MDVEQQKNVLPKFYDSRYLESIIELNSKLGKLQGQSEITTLIGTYINEAISKKTPMKRIVQAIIQFNNEQTKLIGGNLEKWKLENENIKNIHKSIIYPPEGTDEYNAHMN